MGLALLMAAQTSCLENEFGTVDLDLPGQEEGEEEYYEPVKAAYRFNHPCVMFAEEDFDRVRAGLENGSAPQAVKDEFTLLKNSVYTVANYQPTPLEYIVRGDAKGITADGKERYAEAMRDAAAAYQTALLWKLTGDKKYAEISVNVMNAWARVCKEVKSNDANHKLAAGVQGYTFANAAELMRDYDGWSKADFSAFKTWLVNVFASKNKEFLEKHQGMCYDHYWSNWDLVNMCSYLAIGIVTENSEMVNYVVNYFHDGVGNGALKKLVQGTFDDPLGSGEQITQNQESGRDQGHAMMSVAVAANLCQMAYTLFTVNPSVKELDFFAAKDYLIMKMGEYTALFNLRNGSDQLNASGSWLVTAKQMPFDEYKYCVDCSCPSGHSTIHKQVADDAGRGALRPGWEILYNHYAKVKKLGSGFKYAKLAAEKMRPEGGADGSNRYGTNSGAFDQLGWGTLMLYRE